MRLRRLVLAVVLLPLLLLALAGGTARAKGDITVTGAGVDNRFPNGLHFSLSATSDSSIEEVRLRYRVLPDGPVSLGVPEFEPGESVSIGFQVGGGAELYLAPGATIRYAWELTDASGGTVTTPTKTAVYDDVRFDFQVEPAAGVRLYWYAGSRETAQEMLQVARETLDRMSHLLGAEVDFPVKVWVYADSGDMRPALVHRSEAYEERITTYGTRVTSDTVLVLGSAAFDTLRHELAHIVTGVAGEGPYGALPDWLDEGTAVYAQSGPGNYGIAIERAVAGGNVFSLPAISSAPGDPDKVLLFYGQSWSVASYLIDTYGPRKFARLFEALREGATTDGALRDVYGFDQGGLEDRWRESVGLPPRATSPPEDGARSPGPGQNGTASSAGDGNGTGLIVALVAAVLASALVLGAGGYLLSRRFR
ncbi:MAG: hypothetical protein HYS09_03035 [Chloroflexi bacterium]|nr:hypothetical protein [Chloroflexota bacterium]